MTYNSCSSLVHNLSYLLPFATVSFTDFATVCSPRVGVVAYEEKLSAWGQGLLTSDTASQIYKMMRPQRE